MKIATWNINSVRLRCDKLAVLAKESGADIICLQETKVSDDKFPEGILMEHGYPHLAYSGQKSYNGVAIFSKLPLHDIETLKLVNDDARHISAFLDDGTQIHNFYVPAGGDEPDVNINPKYAHKLKYVELMTEWFVKNRNQEDKMILVGDLNIAPLDNDVWSHKQLLKIISHTPPELERMSDLKNSLGWVDIPREFVCESEKLYSWWSYRNRDWRKSNRGRRLDHVWSTPALKPNIKNAYIMKDARDWKQPSDHVPVVSEFT
jgi:exodeoxyribonuclease III